MADLGDALSNKGAVISGAFECHGCGATVVEGVRDIENGKLTWVCRICNTKSEIRFQL